MLLINLLINMNTKVTKTSRIFQFKLMYKYTYHM